MSTRCYSAEITAKILAGNQARKMRLITELESRTGKPVPVLGPVGRTSAVIFTKPPRITKAPRNATIFDSWLTALIWAKAMSRTRKCYVRKINGRWMAWRDAA